MRWCSAAAFVLATAAGHAAAGTAVSGEIRSDTLWRAQDGPFEVGADLTIAGNATLTIEAGATVRLQPGVNLVVEQGALRVLGSAAQPVVITSARDRSGETPAPGDWGHLAFRDGTDAAATLLQHAEIRYGAGIVVERAALTLDHVTIAGSSGAAIRIDLQSSLYGSDNRAIGNAVNAVVVPPGDILGEVKWELRGIPFVIPAGIVGVGAAPAINQVLPARIEQGETVEGTIRGTRLAGAESLMLGGAGLTASVRPGGDETQVPVTISASASAEVGVVAAELQVAAGKARLDNALTVIPPLPPITATSIAPQSIRRGDTRSFAVSGSALLGAAAVVVDNPGIQLTGLQTTDVQATFDLAAAADARLGTTTLAFQNPDAAKGIATIPVTVRKALPRIVVTPALLGVPPDGSTRQFRIGLNDTDDEDHAFGVAVADATVSEVTPLAFTISAGQTQQVIDIRGLKLGATTLTITSPGLTTVTAQVLVTPEFDRVNTSTSALVGVDLAAATGPGTRTAQPLASPALGIAYGRYISGVEPAALQVGSGPLTLVIRGVGLEGVSGVSFLPATGIVLGAHAVSPDGSTVSIPVSVSADAAPTLRQVVLSGAQQPYAALTSGADRVRVVRPPPEVDSIEPVFVTPGMVTTLTVRGRHLQDASTIGAVPGSGLSLGAWPQASGDGTQLTTVLGVASNAVPGTHAIVVTTPGGVSSTSATAANTLRVVSSMSSGFSPIAAANVGVDKAASTTPAPIASTALAGPLGVVVGATVTERTPAAGTIGETVTLELRGNGLQGVDAVSLLPATGVTPGAPSVTDAGTRVTVSLTIAPDAPQTLRAIQVRAGSASVPFATGSTALFRVTPPLPAIESVEPVLLQIGGPTVTLTVRGVNFKDALAIRILPGDGVTVSGPPSAPASGVLTANVTVAAGATAGARTVVVATPAGETTGVASAANTVTLASTLSPTWTPLVSPDVGVSKDVTDPGAALAAGPVASAALGVAVGPVVSSVEAPVLRPYTSGEVVVRGAGLDQVTAASLSPGGDVVLGAAFQVNAEGTELRIAISVGGNPFGGARELVLQTAAGSVPFSTATAAALQVIPGTQYFLVGSDVGVELGAGPTSHTAPANLPSSTLGVSVGPIVTGVQPPALYPGASGELVVSGSSLGAVDSATFRGAAGVTAGALAANAEGTRLAIPLSVAAGAAGGPRELVLSSGGAAIPYAPAALSQIAVAAGIPAIESIEPIVWRQGDTFPLTIRGTNLGQVRAVSVTPAQGVALDSTLAVSGDGTTLTVRVSIAADAPPTEDGFVTVTTAGGTTPAVRAPSNGFRIVR
jgi:hypothetical protein